jgi:hypothetical protein
MQAMLNGMFILALPALVIVTVIAIIAFRRRNTSARD